MRTEAGPAGLEIGDPQAAVGHQVDAIDLAAERRADDLDPLERMLRGDGSRQLGRLGVEGGGNGSQDVDPFGTPRADMAEAVLDSDRGRQFVEHRDRPIVHRPKMVALQPVGPLIGIEAEPFFGDTLEHGVHQDAALGGLDRHDGRRVGLVADAEHVLTEVAETALGLLLDRGDCPLLVVGSQGRMRPNHSVELGRLWVEASTQRVGTPAQTPRDEVRLIGPGQAFGCRQQIALEQPDGVRLVNLDRHASQQWRRDRPRRRDADRCEPTSPSLTRRCRAASSTPARPAKPRRADPRSRWQQPREGHDPAADHR